MFFEHTKLPGVLKHTVVEFTSAQTGAVVIDPAAGKRVVLLSLFLDILSAATAGIIKLFDETDTVANRILGVRVGVSERARVQRIFFSPQPLGALDNRLLLTTDQAHTVTIFCQSYESDT